MKTLVIVPLIAAVAGCTAVGPEYTRPDVALTPTYAGMSGATAPVALEAGWWRQYRDSLLSELVAQGLARNLDIQTAQEAVRQARANLRATGVNAAVSGDLAADSTRSGANGSRSSDNTAESLNGAVVLDLFGGIRRESEAAQANLAAAQADVETARLSWLAETIAAYANARYYQTALALTRDTIATRQKTIEITRRQYEVGAATEYELAQAQALLETARADLPNYEALFRANVFALATLVDTPAEPLLTRMQKGAPLLRTPGRVKAGVPADLLRNRPDLRASEAALRAAVAEVGVAEADLLPSITLSGTVANSSGTRSWSLGPELSLPVFNRGALHAARDAKVSAARQAELSWRSAVNGAVEDVQVAASNLTQYRRRQVALEQAARSYGHALELAQQNYEAGAITLLDLLDTDRSAASARISAASAANETAQEWAFLQIALGAGAR